MARRGGKKPRHRLPCGHRCMEAHSGDGKGGGRAGGESPAVMLVVPPESLGGATWRRDGISCCFHIFSITLKNVS